MINKLQTSKSAFFGDIKGATNNLTGGQLAPNGHFFRDIKSENILVRSNWQRGASRFWPIKTLDSSSYPNISEHDNPGKKTLIYEQASISN